MASEPARFIHNFRNREVVHGYVGLELLKRMTRLLYIPSADRKIVRRPG